MQKLQFKSGRSLIKSDLDFILTPQELSAQLKRARHSNDIIRQLPSSVTSRLGKVEAHVTLSLVQRIEQTLQQGQWVAVGSRRRNAPIPQNAFKQMPFIERAMTTLEETPAQIVKANYQPVVDDYVLPNVLTHTPVEPTPDHKIVIEFAGQWPSNSASLALSKTDTQPEKLMKPRKDADKAHRSLGEFKGLDVEPRNLYLTVPLAGNPNPLKLPLAENIMPVEKDVEMDEWETVLVPVRALAYLTQSQDKCSAADLKGGYLYVFWKNKLWREFKITEKGYYQDIDVEYYRTKDKQARQEKSSAIEERIAEGFPLPQFWVPYKVSGEIQQGDTGIKLLFSPHQRPYEKIEKLEADSAKLAQSTTPLDEISVYSDTQLFEVKENISDIPSAQLHSVTDDDMPWFTDKEVVMRCFDDSNTVAAYVDGHNTGFRVTLEVGLKDDNLGESPEVYAVLQDANSEWQQTVLMSPESGENSCHEYGALMSGLPTTGSFTLFIANPKDNDSAECVFQDLSYQEIVEPVVLPEAELPEPAPEPDEQAVEKANHKNELMSFWNRILNESND